AVQTIFGVLRATPEFSDPALTSFEWVESSSFQLDANLVILLLGNNSLRGYESLRRLRQQFAGLVLAVGGIDDAKFILRTIQGGADVYLDEADLVHDLEAALGRLLQRLEAAAMGRLTAIVSASGGTGVSTLAVNIAALHAHETGRSLLVEL